MLIECLELVQRPKNESGKSTGTQPVVKRVPPGTHTVTSDAVWEKIKEKAGLVRKPDETEKDFEERVYQVAKSSTAKFLPADEGEKKRAYIRRWKKVGRVRTHGYLNSLFQL